MDAFHEFRLVSFLGWNVRQDLDWRAVGLLLVLECDLDFQRVLDLSYMLLVVLYMEE